VCGIAGAVGAQDPLLAQRMIAVLRHRGPDGTGYWARDNCQMAVARLSIIDLRAGCQLITNETGSISIAFNGEIYNYRQLRTELERRGHVFTTKTDTEVVVHLYEEAGADCVRQLRGMFAFAVFDGKQVFLARDRLGIKPLHYAFVPEAGLFLFASEVKAILQCPAFSPRLDMQALADSIVLSHAVGTRTFVEGVQSLAPGHTLTVPCHSDMRVGEQLPYFVRHPARDESISLKEAQNALEDVLEDSVGLHLAADVDVGLTLSGGLDSTILALLAQERHRPPLITFTLADDVEHPDLAQAGVIAEMLAAEHHPVVLGFDEYLSAIPSLIAAEEQPSSLYGIPFQLLCTRIAERVKVCLHGEGADELFGGYREYLDRQHKLSAICRGLPLLKRLGVMPSDEAIAIIERLSSTASFDDYLSTIFAVNLADPLERHHLDVVDKCAMAAGVEIRVPYLDDRVFELVSQLPLRFLVRADIGIRKYILRLLCLERFGLRLTDVVLREKLGVPSSGVHHLMRFDRLCDEILPEDYLVNHELGYCFASKRQLLMFEMFIEIFMVHRGDSNAVGNVLDYLEARGDGRKAINVLDGSQSSSSWDAATLPKRRQPMIINPH
jgi:asparagine synthase (glutamine-hydrolysing)